MVKTKNVTLTVLLPKALKDAALAHAQATDTTLSRAVRAWLKQWVKEGVDTSVQT